VWAVKSVLMWHDDELVSKGFIGVHVFLLLNLYAFFALNIAN
jgi:hypothetical protein